MLWTTGPAPPSSEVYAVRGAGSQRRMAPSALLVIVVGIVLALLVNYIIGIIVILVGLAMLLLPALSGRTRRA